MDTAADVLITADMGLAAYAMTLGARLEGLVETRPGRFDFKLSNLPSNIEADYLNNGKVGARDFLAAYQSVKTALAGAARKVRR